MKTKHNGLTLISFIAAVVGVIVSFSLLREDVLSTAKTLFEYFPTNFGVIPAMTWDGAIYLGVFVSVTQIVSASVALRKELAKALRLIAGLLFVLSMPFDAWTDIVFRSGGFTGDILVAIITTVAFYTFGSEIMQSLSWLIVLTTWRQAVRELMWFGAKGCAGFKSIKGEWATIRRNASNSEQREVASENVEQYQSIQRNATYHQPHQNPHGYDITSPMFSGIPKKPTYHPIKNLNNEK